MNMHLIATFVVGVTLSAAPTFADPIVIKAGHVIVPAVNSSSPPFGFELIGDNTDLGGVTLQESGDFVTIGTDKNLSSQIDLTTFYFGPFGQQVEGKVFTNVALRGTVNFSAGSVRITTDSRGFQTPFTMSGEFSLFDFNVENRQVSATPFFTGALFGRGIASTGYYGEEVGRGVFRSSGIFYNFEAPATVTPEPGTLTLLAGGLVTITMRARRRRRARVPANR